VQDPAALLLAEVRGVAREQGKPPVNGRELTADDVRYTFERLLTEKGSTHASMYRSIAKVEATDRYTVTFTLKEPFAWFLDMLANPMSAAICARECVEKFGDLKKPESVIGTGPWMLDGYKPNQSLALVRHPNYFVPGKRERGDHHAASPRSALSTAARQA
jgi:peptide/nickel transport system substrate-binding protein